MFADVATSLLASEPGGTASAAVAEQASGALDNVLSALWRLINLSSSWSNYSDLTRPHPKWWFSKEIPLFKGNLGW